jgi:OmpA-OmpF porin, OOP family
VIRSLTLRVCLLSAFFAFGLGGAQAQDWLLDARASHFYMETAKAESIVETHQFTGLDGSIGANGDAKVTIDLTSVASGVDVRDVRMRFLLFETYKYPNADITAKLDMGRLQEVLKTTRIMYPLTFTVGLHGMTKDFETLVYVTRLSDTTVSVSTVKPIIVTADTFGLTAGIAKLSEAVNGTPIVSAASFTFDLVFQSGSKIAAVEQERAAAAQLKQQQETSQITAEECQTRFSVISTTGAIYFRTGSAELEHSSDALLNSVADVANRCPSVKIEVSGHTDSVGSAQANLELSVARAKSVAAFLTQRGVAPARITTAGFGDAHPVASNDTDAGRAKNRRIEFRVLL